MAVTGTGPVLGAITTGADALDAVTWGGDYATDVGTLQPRNRQIKRGDAAWRAIAASEIVPNGMVVGFREFAFNEAAVGDAFYTEFVTATGAELTPLELRTSVTDPHTGVTYNFVAADGVTPEARQVGQHFLGDWFVIATPENPVRIGSTTPAFQRGTGTIRRWRGNAASGDLWINGAMLNPSRLARELDVSPNWGQGFNSYTYDPDLGTPGRLELNVDPGYTGAPLVLSGDGDVLVKAKCYWLSSPPTLEEMGGVNDNIGTITLNYACLTVRHNVPRARALRPACAPSMKFATLDTTVDDIDVAKFVQLDQSGLSPLTFRQYADRMKQISSYGFAFHDDNSRNIRAVADVGPDFVLPSGYIANEAGYDRDEHRRFSEAFCGALRAPTTADNSADERLRLIAGLVQYALDGAADIYAGANRNTSGAGYGMGWASVVSLAYLALGYSWIATLRAIPVPNADTGTTSLFYQAHPSGNFPARPEFGIRSAGCVEDNRFVLLPADYVAFPVMQVDTTPGRAYPLAFQEPDIGRPIWITMDGRFFLGSASRIFRGSIDPRMAYHDMQGTMHAAIIAIYLMDGGRAVYNNDAPLLTIDRIRWLHNAGLTKTGELGFSGYTAAFAAAFRGSVTPALWAGAPERPRAPTVDGYVGDPSIIRVTPHPVLMPYGHEIIRHDLRYTTTQPSTTDYNEPIWTVLNDITFDPSYDITGLSFPAGTKVFVQHQYWTSEGRSGWSPSHRATTRYLLNEDGTRNRLLGAYEDPDGSQGAVVTSAAADIANTVAPRIIGSPTIGADLVFDRGEWSVEPWNWSQISWRVNGNEVATGDTWRVPASGVAVGASVTVAWTTANSSSSQSGTTAAVIVRAAETFDVPLTASVMTLTNTGNPADRTRLLTGVSDGSHPVRRLAMLAMATSTGGDATSQIMRLQTSGGANVDAGVNNELTALRRQVGSGGRIAAVRWYDVASATTGGVRLSYWADPFRDVLSGMSAFDLGAQWDLANAWTDGDRAVSAVDPEDPLTPFELTASIRDYRGKPRLVPEGSLILSAVVFGRSENLSDELPVWSGNVSVLPGMAQIGLVSAAASVRHLVSVAAGIQSATGPCDVTVETPQADSFYAFSTLVIPPM